MHILLHCFLIACNCHPRGSMGKVCDQSTGQCPCKEGVTGRECGKCATGYETTKSAIVPCISEYSLLKLFYHVRYSLGRRGS